MSKSISRLIPVLALFWCVRSSSQQHLICKNIEDVFPEDGIAETQPRHSGVQGPAEIFGPKGERGNRAPPVQMDYDLIDDIIAVKVTNSFSVINSTIAELSRNVSTLLSEWERLKPTIERKDAAEVSTAPATTDATTAATPEDECRVRVGLLHSGKCFTLPYLSSSVGIKYDEAVAECAKQGTLMAEIHDRVQQTALYNFALTKMPAGTSKIAIWFGMEYQHSTSSLLYRSGMEKHSSQFQWYPGYPSTSSPRKYIIMNVRNDGSSNFGLWNYLKARPLSGVMCEKET